MQQKPGDDIKLEFVARSLAKYNQRATEELSKKMNSLDIKVTGDLNNSISSSKVPATSRNQGEARIHFVEYGRMVDMGAGRSVSRKGKKTAKEKRELNKRRQPKKFYSPTVYGLINPLISSLQYGLTDEVAAQIKTDLQHVS
jgi:hypothetical protein